MKCEFCEKTIPDGSVSCSYCGSLVRNAVSSTSHTVISLEQQKDIGNYKMSSDYKSPKANNSDKEILYGIDMSHQKFAAQKFTSSEGYKPPITNAGNAIIGENISAPLPSAAEKNNNGETSHSSLQESVPKKCEFCGKDIAPGEVSCPACGSLVRRVMSDKGNTVISVKQQNDIGNYKMKSSYTTPQTEASEGEIHFGKEMSHGEFTQQSITDENAYTPVASGRDVYIRSEENNGIPNPNSGSYSMRKESTEKTPEFVTQKRVSLFKKRRVPKNYVNAYVPINEREQIESDSNNNVDTKPAFDFRKKRISKKYANAYVPLYGSEYTETNEAVRIAEENTKEIADVPGGLNKDQFMKLIYLHSVRVPFFAAIVILYICMVGMLFTSIYFMNPYQLITIPLIMVLTFGLQFKYSYSCAFGTLLFGIIYSITGIIFYYSFLGIPILVAGIFSYFSVKRFNTLWDMYIETGTLPYARRRF